MNQQKLWLFIALVVGLAIGWSMKVMFDAQKQSDKTVEREVKVKRDESGRITAFANIERTRYER